MRIARNANIDHDYMAVVVAIKQILQLRNGDDRSEIHFEVSGCTYDSDMGLDVHVQCRGSFLPRSPYELTIRLSQDYLAAILLESWASWRDLYERRLFLMADELLAYLSCSHAAQSAGRVDLRVLLE